MAGQEQVMLVISQQEWTELKRTLTDINRGAQVKSKLERYKTREWICNHFGISSRTYSRLKSNGVIIEHKLGNTPVVFEDDIVKAIESKAI